MEFQYEFAGKSYPVHIKREGDGYKVTVGEEVFDVTSKEMRPGFFNLTVNGKPSKISMASEGSLRHIFFQGHVYKFTRAEGKRKKTEELEMLSPDIASPISGKIVKVDVNDGANVTEGQVLMTIEAMKMEYQIKAPYAGTVERVHFSAGDQVDIGVVLANMKKED
jgi:3-methylcrotonyl-CoA carboxylase alpha subunit